MPLKSADSGFSRYGRLIAMRLVPEDNSGKIQFFATRVARWAEHAAELGVSPEDIAALTAATAEARADDAAQRAAQAAAMAATMRRDTSVERMARRGAAIIQQIRARAAIEGDGVYAMALISPPSDPSPLPAPGKPYDIRVELQQSGWFTLRWKSKNARGAAGTVYHVERSLDGGPAQFLAVTGERSFVDATVPAGTRAIVYRIRGVRSTAVGALAEHIVHLNGDGMRGIPVMHTSSRKKATLLAA